MLLEFRLKNYRSFKDESVFSLVATRDRTRDADNVFPTGIKSVPSALRSAAIYGANASGKSNLLRGLMLMRGVILESPSLQPGQQYLVQPFRLDSQSATEPTLLEVTLAIQGVRYQYGFEFTATRITSEWLLVYQTGKPQKWFERSQDSDGRSLFEFGSMFPGAKRTWQEATRDNALFLSTAVQLNSERLRPIHDWFSSKVHVFMDGGHIPHDYSTRAIQLPEKNQEIVGLLAAADIGISAISARPAKGFIQNVTFDLATGQSNTSTREAEILLPAFSHRLNDVSVEFDLEDESQGTQKIFALAGPIFDILKNGYTLIIDELDRSLHPLLCRKIIQAFHDPEMNPKGAQLLFTTHDTSLLATAQLRRDQIWFADKGVDQSSRLTALSDFSPRNKEALERGYLSGRYGGVPTLGSNLFEISINGK